MVGRCGIGRQPNGRFCVLPFAHSGSCQYEPAPVECAAPVPPPQVAPGKAASPAPPPPSGLTAEEDRHECDLCAPGVGHNYVGEHVGCEAVPSRKQRLTALEVEAVRLRLRFLALCSVYEGAITPVMKASNASIEAARRAVAAGEGDAPALLAAALELREAGADLLSDHAAGMRSPMGAERLRAAIARLDVLVKEKP